LIEASSSLVESVDRAVSKDRAEAIRAVRHARRQLSIVLPIAALVTLQFAILLGWHAKRSITGPLSTLKAAAFALASGDFQRRVDLGGEDELATLGRAFNHAAQQLCRAEEERERLGQLQADLAHINRVSMLGELAASWAHEIKQPIAAAAMNAGPACDGCSATLRRLQKLVRPHREWPKM
jgi:methyl-accepting chemotaxis protein